MLPSCLQLARLMLSSASTVVIVAKVQKKLATLIVGVRQQWLEWCPENILPAFGDFVWSKTKLLFS